MDKNVEYSTIDLHQHSVYSCEEPNANMKVRDMMDYYRLLAEISGKRVAFSITDHENVDGSFVAWKLKQMFEKEYQNVDFVPGMEISVSCNNVLTYDDSKFNDQKFVFKKMHILAHAKKGRELEFFKRTVVISQLNKMILQNKPNAILDKKVVAKNKDEKLTKYVFVGRQIMAARSLIKETYGVKIAFEDLAPCTQMGKTYGQIRDKFIEIAYDKIKGETDVFDNKTKEIAMQEISKAITNKRNKANPAKSQVIFPPIQVKVKDFCGLGRVDICELAEIFGDCATFCYAHPQTLKLHKHSKIPVCAFKGVDISSLPQEKQDFINQKLVEEKDNPDALFNAEEIMYHGDSYDIDGDFSGIVKLQILHNMLKQKGVHFDGYEVTQRVAHKKYIFNIMDTVVDNCGLQLNFGTDKHYNHSDKFFFVEDAKKVKVNPADNQASKIYFQRYKARCVKNPYFELNQNGFVNQEETEFAMLHTEDY